MAKCRVCGRRAVIKIYYARTALCREHFIQFYERRVERAMTKYGLVGKGWRVLVAVSGGKDSVSLLHVLKRLSDKMGFEVLALHIDLGIGEFSSRALSITEGLCRELSLPLIIFRVRDVLGIGVPELAKLARRPPCSVCGMVKRYVINAVAVEVGADVVATGHNLDDLAANALKEFLNQNLRGVGKLGPKTESISGIAVGRVRPLYDTPEREDLAYALVNKLPFVRTRCPYVAEGSIERYLKRYLNELDALFPGVKVSFMRRLASNLSIYYSEEGVRKCRYCGLISSGDVCTYCKVTARGLGGPAGPKTREYIKLLVKAIHLAR